MDHGDAKRIGIVLVNKVERLSRSPIDFADVMERLSATGAWLTLNMRMNHERRKR